MKNEMKNSRNSQNPVGALNFSNIDIIVCKTSEVDQLEFSHSLPILSNSNL